MSYAGITRRRIFGQVSNIRHRAAIRVFTLTLASIAFGTEQGAAQSGPTSHWQLDETSGTTARDAAGGAAGVLANGASWTSGRIGGAVSLDGVNDFIALPSIDVPGSALSLTAWVRSSSFPSNSDQRFIAKSIDTSEQSHYWLLGQANNGQNRLRFRLRAGGTTTTLIATSGTLPLNAWYHAAAVYDGSSMRLYLNGVLVGSMSKTGSIATNAAVPVAIGRNPDGTNHLHGAIDDVRIYRRALTAAEVSALAQPSAVDTKAPSTPLGLTATAVSSTQIDLRWTASTDEVGVAGYRVYRAGALIGTVASPAFSATGLSPSTSYTFTVAAFDATGNESPQSSTASGTTAPGADLTPPVISGLGASSITTSSATISWSTSETASTRVEYGPTAGYGLSTTVSGQRTSHSVALTGLQPATSYSYRAVSVDAAGNQAMSQGMALTTVPSASPADGAVARWNMDEGAGATATDSVAGRVGTLMNGATWTSGHTGSAVVLDGINDYVALPTFDVTGSGMTIAAWVKSSSFPSSVDQRFVSKATDTAEQSHYWLLGLTGNRLRFRLKTGQVTTTLIATSGTLPVNTWCHVAATYDGVSMRLYLNGVDVGAIAKSGAVAGNASVPVNIGRNPDGSNYLHGAIDDVRIYNRGLTSGEIVTLATGTGGNPAPGNAAPTVSLTSPAAGAAFQAPAAVTLSANASDPDGSVTRVSFYNGTTLIGSDTTAPYTFAWSNVATGSYSLTAVATDNLGAETTSASRTIVVASNQFPIVSLTSPANGSTFTAPATVPLAATASDADGTVMSVEFYAGSTLIGSDGTSPYTGTWNNAPAGTHTLTAVARDNAGWSTVSVSRMIIVNLAPTTARAVFTPSSNHDTAVIRYVLEVFRQSDDPRIAAPVATQDLGKPAVQNAECTVDVSQTISSLPTGTYIAVLYAVGSGGETASDASPAFNR